MKKPTSPSYNFFYFNLNKIFLMLFLVCLGIKTTNAQTENVVYYKNGQNGIELIYKSRSGTTIISTYNAKVAIKADVAKNLYEFVKKNPQIKDSLIDITTDQAVVKGCYKSTKVNNLTTVNFHYECIAWLSGLREVYLQ